MTNEDAIEQFQNAIDLIKQNGKDWLDERDIPMLEMAICALKNKQADGDLISRQAVLDLFGDIHPMDYNARAYVAQIKELPSAEKTAEVRPMQVELEADGYADGELVYDFGKCPKCGWEFEEGDKDWGEPYCCHCGQKLKWFESEDSE